MTWENALQGDSGQCSADYLRTILVDELTTMAALGQHPNIVAPRAAVTAQRAGLPDYFIGFVMDRPMGGSLIEAAGCISSSC